MVKFKELNLINFKEFMKKYKDQFLRKRIFYSNFSIALFLIVLFLCARGVLNLYKKYKSSREDLIFVEKEEDESRLKLENNKQKLENINTESGKEKYIRETFPVKKEGEGLIIVYDDQASTYEIPKKVSNWDIFLEFIKKMFHF